MTFCYLLRWIWEFHFQNGLLQIKTAAFATPYAENNYPILVALNEYLYVKYSVESSANLVIMAENCKATRDGSFYSWPYYTIIQNG